MVSPNLPAKEELLKQHELYNAAAAILLQHGVFRGDGIYAWGSTPVITEEGVIDGIYRLTDYNNYCLRNYTTEEGQAEAQTQQNRALLENRTAIIDIQLYNQTQQQCGNSYTMCHPSLVNPYSVVGEDFYTEEHPLDASGKPLSTPLVPAWHVNELAIVRLGYGLITDISREEQLQRLLRAFQNQ